MSSLAYAKIVAVLGSLAALALAQAQTISTGEVTGTALDSTGRVVVGAVIVLKRTDTGESRAIPSDAAESAVAHLQPPAAAKRIRIRLDVDDSTREVELDRTAIEDALNNLLENAIKYSPPETQIVICVRHGSTELAKSLSGDVCLRNKIAI